MVHQIAVEKLYGGRVVICDAGRLDHEAEQELHLRRPQVQEDQWELGRGLLAYFGGGGWGRGEAVAQQTGEPGHGTLPIAFLRPPRRQERDREELRREGYTNSSSILIMIYSRNMKHKGISYCTYHVQGAQDILNGEEGWE